MPATFAFESGAEWGCGMQREDILISFLMSVATFILLYKAINRGEHRKSIPVRLRTKYNTLYVRISSLSLKSIYVRLLKRESVGDVDMGDIEVRSGPDSK